jgi:YggT family protein
MFVIGELLWSLARLVSLALNILYFILVIRIILSWVNPDPYNQVVQVIYRITEPILAPFRRLPLQIGGVDFSPIVAFLVLNVAGNFIVNVLRRIALRLG